MNNTQSTAFTITVYKPNFPWNNAVPRCEWTLEDMLKSLQISDFDILLKQLRTLESDVDLSAAENGSPYDKVSYAWNQYLPKTSKLLDQVMALFGPNGLDIKHTIERAALLSVLVDEKDTLSLGELHSRLRDLREEIEFDLKGHVFLYLPPTSLQLYYQKDALFGEEVKTAFPHSKLDIREAGLGTLMPWDSTLPAYST